MTALHNTLAALLLLVMVYLLPAAVAIGFADGWFARRRK